MGSAGKVRIQTPFVPSKHLTAKQARQIHLLANPPQQAPGQATQQQPIPFFYTNFTSFLHDNQKNRKKERTGRDRKRHLFNTRVKRWNGSSDDHGVSNEPSFSLVYPKKDQESGFYEYPKASESINSIQTQFHRSQQEEFKKQRTIQNRSKRTREKMMKKMEKQQEVESHHHDRSESLDSTSSSTSVSEESSTQPPQNVLAQRIQFLMQTPPLRAAPRTADSSSLVNMGWSSRMTALTNVSYARPGKVH
ncbi:hypothetical protein FDP41_001530 [Naegleria fowleri]|uniref:Uncharacterized protein n=1 Tax=Naegleria fowleri TaxID=5763 RepID=A0A6A5BPZ9_NAEFO|nr:uncharacterized protein FDP41_001530 [Naegleria fowleri]KAF0979187.1 hypothetical protein FDP41_001530 [Naegleria fowleri]CAG4716420.1 unnamed protein product [Naegleria fowleri]